MSALETFVVYAYPEVMDKVNYIQNWSPQRLYDLVGLEGKIKRDEITNIKVLDGEMANLPYEDDTFNIVMSGHVVGDDYDAEMTRVVKYGGFIVCCNGDDDFKRKSPNNELVQRGFDFFMYESCEDGIIYNYRKKVLK